MNIFGYTLRKPWVKLVNFTIEDELVTEIMKSLASQYVAAIISNDLCDAECEVIEYLEKTVKP